MNMICIFLVINGFWFPSHGKQKLKTKKITASRVIKYGIGRDYSILGLKKTSEPKVRSFLWPHGENKPLRKSDVDDLRNLTIFETVEHLNSSEVKVKERWTIIPVFKVQSGGGVTNFTAGIFDPNIFGQLSEIGAQYGNLAGQNSVVFWGRRHRIWGRNRLGFELWNMNRLRFLYNGSGAQESAFVAKTGRYYLFIENQTLPYLWLGAGLDFNNERVSVDDLSNEFQNNFSNFFNQSNLNSRRDKLWLRFFARLGRLNTDIPFQEGQELSLEVRYADQNLLSSQRLFATMAQWRGFARKGNHNWGGRIIWEYTSSLFPEDQLYVGGLDRVRGFLDGQFYGQNSVVGNLEYRYRFLKIPSRWVELQSVVFSDAGRLNDKDMFFASVGGGLRIISPRIYRLSVRLDVAQVLTGQPGSVFSFGLQQFF